MSQWMDRNTTDWIDRGLRRSARLTGTALWPNGSRCAVAVTDMSYEGCRLSSNRPFVKGETLTVSVPTLGSVRVQIRWIREGIAGARFLTGDSEKDARRARIGV